MSTSRSFVVEDTTYKVTGWSEDDTYLSNISDRFEYKFQELCRLALNDGATAMDIGANIGVTSIILSHFNKNGQIIAIEPGRKLTGILQGNIAKNNISNVATYDYAISSQSQKMAFTEHSAFGHLQADSLKVDDIDAVQALTLDDLIERLGLDRLHFLKIDTEGFEPQVFAGGAKTLERFKPLVFFELNTWTLLAYGKNDPLQFAKSVCEQFKHVYRVKKDAPDLYLEKLEGSPDAVSTTMIHDNIAFNNSWDDYLVCNDEAKVLDLCERVNRDYAAKARVRATPAAIRRDLARRIARRAKALLTGGKP